VDKGWPLRFWRETPKSREILGVVGIVLALVVVTLGVQWLLEFLFRRRERRLFYEIMDKKGLSAEEEEVMRTLANDALLRSPSEALLSVALFDSIAEKNIQSALKANPRAEVEARMDLFYEIRAKLFPEASDWRAIMATRKHGKTGHGPAEGPMGQDSGGV
jgi:hypothetical protein